MRPGAGDRDEDPLVIDSGGRVEERRQALLRHKAADRQDNEVVLARAELAAERIAPQSELIGARRPRVDVDRVGKDPNTLRVRTPFPVTTP